MAYPIRYTRTCDGVNIAYCDLGEGEPVIYSPAIPWSNVSAMLTKPLITRQPLELAGVARMLIFDARGCGLSDHGVEDLSLEGFARDIDAVAEAAGCETFSLYGSADASRPAIYYAATRPERVSKLILWIPSVSTERLRADPLLRAVRPLAERDWDVYRWTMAHAVVGGWDADRALYAATWAELMDTAIRQDEFPRFAAAMREHDVSAYLEKVRAPTLVLTREDAAVYRPHIVREVAAGIANATLVVSPGCWLLPCTSDDITAEIIQFLQQPAGEHEAFPAERRTNGTTPVAAKGNGHKLSPREREVLELISQGKTNAEIGDALVVTHATASRHVHNILTKLNMNRRAEAAAYAVYNGMGAGT